MRIDKPFAKTDPHVHRASPSRLAYTSSAARERLQVFEFLPCRSVATSGWRRIPSALGRSTWGIRMPITTRARAKDLVAVSGLPQEEESDEQDKPRGRATDDEAGG